MNKKDIVKTLDIASFVAAVVATILVLIFQFTGSVSVMKYSIIMYVVCFMMLTIVLSFKVYFAFSNKHQAEEQTKTQESNVETEENDAQAESNDTKKKTLSIVYLALSAIAFIFTFVLLILY